MDIRTVELNKDGSYLVNKNVDADDDRQMTVPNDTANRHYWMVQEWIDGGNTPDPYGEPEVPYQDQRVKAYGRVKDQLDMQYWDKKNGTDNWVKHIDKVKSDIPKG